MKSPPKLRIMLPTIEHTANVDNAESMQERISSLIQGVLEKYKEPFSQDEAFLQYFSGLLQNLLGQVSIEERLVVENLNRLLQSPEITNLFSCIYQSDETQRVAFFEQMLQGVPLQKKNILSDVKEFLVRYEPILRMPVLMDAFKRINWEQSRSFWGHWGLFPSERERFWYLKQASLLNCTNLVSQELGLNRIAQNPFKLEQIELLLPSIKEELGFSDELQLNEMPLEHKYWFCWFVLMMQSLGIRMYKFEGRVSKLKQVAPIGCWVEEQINELRKISLDDNQLCLHVVCFFKFLVNRPEELALAKVKSKPVTKLFDLLIKHKQVKLLSSADASISMTAMAQLVALFEKLPVEPALKRKLLDDTASMERLLRRRPEAGREVDAIVQSIHLVTSKFGLNLGGQLAQRLLKDPDMGLNIYEILVRWKNRDQFTKERLQQLCRAARTTIQQWSMVEQLICPNAADEEVRSLRRQLDPYYQRNAYAHKSRRIILREQLTVQSKYHGITVASAQIKISEPNLVQWMHTLYFLTESQIRSSEACTQFQRKLTDNVAIQQSFKLLNKLKTSPYLMSEYVTSVISFLTKDISTEELINLNKAIATYLGHVQRLSASNFALIWNTELLCNAERLKQLNEMFVELQKKPKLSKKLTERHLEYLTRNNQIKSLTQVLKKLNSFSDDSLCKPESVGALFNFPGLFNHVFDPSMIESENRLLVSCKSIRFFIEKKEHPLVQYMNRQRLLSIKGIMLVVMLNDFLLKPEWHEGIIKPLVEVIQPNNQLLLAFFQAIRGADNKEQVAKQLIMEQAARAIMVNEQSTHRASIHSSAAESAGRLEQRYISEQRLSQEFDCWLKSQDGKSVTEVNLSARMAAHLEAHACWKEPRVNINLNQLLVLLWTGIHDATSFKGTVTEGKQLLLQAFDDILNSATRPLCPGGSFNKLIEVFVGMHPDCQLDFICKETATLKALALSKQALSLELEFMARYMITTEGDFLLFLPLLHQIQSEGAGLLWPAVRQSVGDELYDEFQSLYSGRRDELFLSTLENGQYVSLTSLTRQQSMLDDALLKFAEKSDGYGCYLYNLQLRSATLMFSAVQLDAASTTAKRSHASLREQAIPVEKRARKSIEANPASEKIQSHQSEMSERALYKRGADAPSEQERPEKLRKMASEAEDVEEEGHPTTKKRRRLWIEEQSAAIQAHNDIRQIGRGGMVDDDIFNSPGLM